MKGLFTLVIPLFLAVGGVVTGQQPPVAPQPVMVSAFAKHKNKFYIYGGLADISNNITAPSGQFFALDLSKPWTSTAPAWIQLPSGPSRKPPPAIELDRNFTRGAISADGKIFMVLPEKGLKAHRFSFENNTWVPSKSIFRGTINHATPVTLGTSGLVLIAGGDPVSEPDMRGFYDIYSFDNDQTMTEPLPMGISRNPYFMMGRQGYGAVWSQYLKKAVFYGGFFNGTGRDVTPFNSTFLVTYDPELRQWMELPTTGWDMFVFGHCMAITDDGMKLLSYGGSYNTSSKSNTGDLYNSHLNILDLTTNTWTQVNDAGPKRAVAACTVAGDYFLLWGGQDVVSNKAFDAGKPSTPVALYRISLNGWVQQYEPSADYLNPVSTTPSASATGSSPSSPLSPNPSDKTTMDEGSTTNIGAIAGGVGGAAVVLLVGFLVWRRRKQGAKLSRLHVSTSETDQHSAAADKSRDYREHGVRRMPRAISPVDTYQPSQHAHVPYNAVDGGSDNIYKSRDGYMYTTKRSTPSRTPAPHYPSWGASFGESYASDASEYNTDMTPHSLSSPTSPYDYIPPPPAVSRSRSRKPREPQTSAHRHMAREHFYAPDGRRVEERPGPQWRSG